MNLQKLAHVDINHGLDFELAQERLSAEAGRLFRRYRELKADPSRTPAEVDEAREAYIEAQTLYRNIRS